tara:strand:+ start:837 stop:1031 length:195 start_codon:yes stop_codon:yes gene_type:complete
MEPRLYISDEYIIFEGEPVAKIWDGACEIAVKKFEYFVQDIEEITENAADPCSNQDERSNNLTN